MDIQELRFFLEVVEDKHFTIAAAELNISQSSLSKHIKALEDEFGIKLFNRSTRSVKLTEEGNEFLEYARRIVRDYDEIKMKMGTYKEKNKKTLTIGTIPVMSQYGITSVIASFTRQNKDIDINVIEGRSPEILALLDSSEIDIALIRTISLTGDDYKINPLVDDDLVMIVPKDHPFAKNKSLDLSLASQENFIFLDSGRGIHDLCMEACLASDFKPNILNEYTRIETIIGVVAEGLGVSLLMRRVVEFFNNKDIVIVDLKDRFTTTVALVTSAHGKPSEKVKKFTSYTMEWFKDSEK